MDEIELEFRDIPDFPGYRMNPIGVVINSRSGAVLKSRRETSRYVKLRKDGKTYDRAISRLRSEIFPEL